MELGKVYFWNCEYNYDNDCYSVVEVKENEYVLMRVRVGEPDFTDFWRISFKYYEKHKEWFIEVENDEHYRKLVNEKMSA